MRRHANMYFANGRRYVYLAPYELYTHVSCIHISYPLYLLTENTHFYCVLLWLCHQFELNVCDRLTHVRRFYSVALCIRMAYLSILYYTNIKLHNTYCWKFITVIAEMRTHQTVCHLTDGSITRSITQQANYLNYYRPTHWPTHLPHAPHRSLDHTLTHSLNQLTGHQANCNTEREIDSMTHSLTHSLTESLTHWLIDSPHSLNSLTDRLVAILKDRLAEWLIDSPPPPPPPPPPHTHTHTLT